MADESDYKPSLPASLGMLVEGWACLEATVSWALAVLLEIDEHPQNDAVVGYIGFRDKLDIIKAWGFALRPNEGWHGRVEEIINKIDTDLRPRRNRLIHHGFRPGTIPGGTLVIDPKPKLRRPQALQRVLKQDSIEISTADVDQLVSEIFEVITALLEVIGDFPRRA